MSDQCHNLSLSHSHADSIANLYICFSWVSEFNISQFNLADKLVLRNQFTSPRVDLTLGPHHGDHLTGGSQHFKNITEYDTNDEEIHEQLHHVEEETCDITNCNLSLILEVCTVEDNSS